MREPSPNVPRAFTLVELLVVIAVITVLIALLLPILAKVRRQALVLASPVAFVGQDRAVYLTGPRGGAELRLTESGWEAESFHGLTSPLAWSPCGQRLAVMGRAPDNGPAMLLIFEPFTGRIWKHRFGGRFAGWIDSERYLGSGAWNHDFHSAQTGRVLGRFRLPDDRHYDTFAPAPIASGGRYIASIHGADHLRPYIGLVRKDFMPAKPLWTWPETGRHNHMSPQIDPLGEWLAWPQQRSVAVRHLRSPPSMALTLFQGPYYDATFCDWTEDQHVLVNGSLGARSELSVYSRDGNLIRKIETDTPPEPRSVAAYRKYTHR